jgi:predicted RNA-binding Zn-ribbon protein involved in translation (DUF1610 family)
VSTPTNMEEFNAKVMANITSSGYGLETTQHFACPGCAEPDWKLVKVVQAPEAFAEPSTCKHCGRTFKALVGREDGATSFEFVQTGGDDLPDWMRPRMRRV